MKEDIHHLVKAVQGAEKCLYCGTHLNKDDWFAEMYDSKHYRENKCRSCGKLTKILADFEGSLGKNDDTWLDRTLLLENIVK